MLQNINQNETHGTNMGTNWNQKGIKIKPKWEQHGNKLEHNGARSESKYNQNRTSTDKKLTAMEPKWSLKQTGRAK